MENLEIKILSRDDIQLMSDVINDDNMIYNPEYIKSFIESENCFGFIAKFNKKIVGFAYAYSLIRPDGKLMFYLHSIGILPDYQDKGIGTKLLKFILDYAKENKYSECFVITDKGNPRACHLYEKLGGKNDFENEIVYVYNFENISKDIII